MKWVHTDLNSPWDPIDERPAHYKHYPEQYRRVDNDLADRLKVAWDALYAISAEVDKKYPCKK